MPFQEYTISSANDIYVYRMETAIHKFDKNWIFQEKEKKHCFRYELNDLDAYPNIHISKDLRTLWQFYLHTTITNYSKLKYSTHHTNGKKQRISAIE